MWYRTTTICADPRQEEALRRCATMRNNSFLGKVTQETPPCSLQPSCRSHHCELQMQVVEIDQPEPVSPVRKLLTLRSNLTVILASQLDPIRTHPALGCPRVNVIPVISSGLTLSAPTPSKPIDVGYQTRPFSLRPLSVGN